MRSFVRKHLDPVDRLGEVLFGLIMALGFTGAVRIGAEEADNRTLFVSILGCNIAWGVVDGVMFALLALFERGRRARISRRVLESPSEEAALEMIGRELDERLAPVTSPEERRQIYRRLMEHARRENWMEARLERGDVLGGAAVGLIIIAATIPVVAPYLVVPNPDVAVRISNLIGLVLLFLLGVWWGREAGASPLRIGAGLTAIGLALVGVTILLGG